MNSDDLVSGHNPSVSHIIAVCVPNTQFDMVTEVICQIQTAATAGKQEHMGIKRDGGMEIFN